MSEPMKLIENLTPDFTFTDERGTLTQIVSGGYEQVNAVFTKKGAVRGRFHYHKENRETFFIISGRVLVRAERDGVKEEYEFTSGDMFTVHEYVRHDFRYLEDTYLVGMYSGCVENADGTKDIFTD